MATENISPDAEADSLVTRVIHSWRAGRNPDTQDVLRCHPNLRRHRDLVLDLAYEEYCLRREAGESLVLSTFCERFPTIRKSLRVLLATHECAEEGAVGLRTEWDEIEWPTIESTFLGFHLVREIGRGAFARVYLATQPALGDRLVVVKVSHRGGGEAEMLGRLTHRNIVPIHSVQEDARTLLTAICMPYLGRGTLLKALDAAYETNEPPRTARVFLDVARQDAILHAIPETYTQCDPLLERSTFQDGVVHIMAQLAAALAHAHDAGICHRDLKPSNVLLAPSGCPLLLDFNLSSDGRSPGTIIGGTLPYMPPEQLEDVLVDHVRGSRVDPRSDVFSLGVMLHEALTGQLPYGDQSPGEEAYLAAFRILARQEEGTPPLTQSHPRIDPQLGQIVARCLELEPARRFPSAGELAQQLRGRLTARARLRRWARRRRFLLASSTAACGALAAVAGIGLAHRPPYERRCYVAGITAFESDDLPYALECFTQAHDARPDAYQPLFARGQVLVAWKEYEQAAEDMQRAYTMAPDGPVASWAGYAYQLNARDSVPTYYYLEALNKHRYRTVVVLNNLGHNYRTRKRYADAADCLTQALALDPRCQEAYINRALVWAEYPEQFLAHPEQYRQRAIRDIEMATTLGTNKGLAHFWAAWLHVAHNHSAEKDQMVLNHLRGALDQGFDRTTLLAKSGFDSRYTKSLEHYALDVPPHPIDSHDLLLAPPHRFPAM